MIKLNQVSDKNRRYFLSKVVDDYKSIIESFQVASIHSDLVNYFLDESGRVSRVKIALLLGGSYETLIKAISIIGKVTDNSLINLYKEKFCDGGDLYLWGQKLKVISCPYCNRVYTISKLSKESKIRPQYDHFFLKSIYSYLSVALYNIIPCCPYCNTYKGKNNMYTKSSKNKAIMYPYKEGFEKNIVFSLEHKKPLGLTTNFKIVFDYSNALDKDQELRAKETARVFHLLDFYNQHRDYVLDLIRLKIVHDSSNYLNSIKKDKRFSKIFKHNTDIVDTLYLNRLDISDWIKRPFSKLTSDILDYLLFKK